MYLEHQMQHPLRDEEDRTSQFRATTLDRKGRYQPTYAADDGADPITLRRNVILSRRSSSGAFVCPH